MTGLLRGFVIVFTGLLLVACWKTGAQDPSVTQGRLTQGSGATEPVSIKQKLANLYQAISQNDIDLAAHWVDELQMADFSLSPLSQADIWAMKTEFAEIYAKTDRMAEAIRILETIVAESELVQTQNEIIDLSAPTPDNPAARSRLKLDTADRLIRLGEFSLKQARYTQAYDSFGKALGIRTSIYGFGTTIPDHGYLVESLYKAARLGKLPFNTYCQLKILFAETPPDQRTIDQIQYWGEAEGEICPPLAEPVIGVPDQANYETLTVFFGTSRANTQKRNPDKTFNAQVADLSLGQIEMTVPRNREVGTIQIPGILDFWGAEDGVHIVLKKIHSEPKAEKFQQDLSAHIRNNRSDDKEAFIYIHGHAVSFANAARRTAQLAVDLDMRYGGMFYSWPAGANVVSYFKSQENVDHAARELETFLKLVNSVEDIDTLHIIAHSMGNDVLSRALTNFNPEGYTSENRPFGHIVWASPDMDARDFARNVQTFKTKELAEGMTLYASDKDKALSVSQWIWDRFPRAGQAPPNPDVAKLVQTVDTSQIDRKPTDILAHGDYASAAIDDLRAVIWLSLMPAKRCSLTSRNIEGIAYWSAVKTNTTCDKSLFREAVEIARMKLQPLETREVDPGFMQDPPIVITPEGVDPVLSPAEILAADFMQSRTRR